VLIRTVIGIGAVTVIIIGIVLLATVFGGINLVDYVTQVAVGLTLVAFGIVYWTFKPYIDRRVANQHVEIKPRTTSKSKLDELIQEIEDFIKKWSKGPSLGVSYRMDIEERAMMGNREKIKEYSEEIYSKINRLRRFRGSKATLDSLETVADKMSNLGKEVSSTFGREVTRNQLLGMEQNRIDRLVSEGDTICRELEDIVSQLKKLR
jgi:hypothetical protein